MVNAHVAYIAGGIHVYMKTDHQTMEV
jgi:hypothetical protein